MESLGMASKRAASSEPSAVEAEEVECPSEAARAGKAVWVCSEGAEAVTGCVGCSSPADEAGTDSVTVADVSGTVEDGASCSDEATNNDRRSVVVTGTVKAAGAYRGGGVGSPVRALYEKLRCWSVDESNTSCDAVAD